MSDAATQRFEIHRTVGHGGSGVVYAAYDRVRGMPVAIKELRRATASLIYSFKREFRALADLSHPNVITLYELLCENDTWLLTMELLEGCDFVTYLRGPAQPNYITTLSLPAGAMSSPGTVSPGLGTSTETIGPLAGDQTIVTDAPLTSHESRGAAGLSGLLARVVQGRSLSVSALPVSASAPAPASAMPVTAMTSEDITRLIDAFRQLASALCALHAAGLVHRDLKPSNVIVTQEGRVVLVDFGIVAELDAPRIPELDGFIVGTPAYMAPEQARSEPPSAAADWYAFGVMLYQCLTGRLPHSGSSMEMLVAKQEEDPTPPSAAVAGIPAELDALCMALLAREPHDRPSGADVLTSLGVAAPAPVPAHLGTSTQLFVGRSRELRMLRGAYDAVASGGTMLVLIQGQSGIGKSTLVKRFIDELGGSQWSPTVLSGRCHERETLAYKAFDGIIDNLSLTLAALSKEQRAAVIPATIGLLARLFPVLSQLPEVGPALTDVAVSSMDIRVSAVSALRTLLDALGRNAPVVIRIEDIQWTDRDSVALLTELLRPPTPRRLLFVTTIRDESLDPARRTLVHELLAFLDRHEMCKRITIGLLSEDEQRELAGQLARDHRASTVVDALWQQSGGHPMLLAELIRSASEDSASWAHTGELDLADVIWRRVERLSPPGRALLETLAAAGEPAPLTVLTNATALVSADVERAAAELRTQNLARVARTQDEPWLEVYHDKIRDAVLAHLSGKHRRLVHERLARALQLWSRAVSPAQRQSLAATLARHWLAAGYDEQAGRYLVIAGDSAYEKLALGQAAELYRAALAVLPKESELLRCQAWIGLAKSLRMLEESMVEVEDALRQAEPIAHARGLGQVSATIHYLRGAARFVACDGDGCLRENRLAYEHADRAGSIEFQARALSGMGDAYLLLGRSRTAAEHYQRCVELCQHHSVPHIEATNLAMRATLRWLDSDPAGAIDDCLFALRLARESGNLRAEVLTRAVVFPSVLIDMERLVDAANEVAMILPRARQLGMPGFAVHGLTVWARSLLAQGNEGEAVPMVEEALDIIMKGSRSALLAPFALGLLSRMNIPQARREWALTEGERLIDQGTGSFTYITFCGDAIEAALRAGDYDLVERFADKLDAYNRAEPMGLARLLAARARALVDLRRGRIDGVLMTMVRRLYDEASRAQLFLYTRELGEVLRRNAGSPSRVSRG